MTQNFCTVCSHTCCCYCYDDDDDVYINHSSQDTPHPKTQEKKWRKGALWEVHGFHFHITKQTHLFTNSSSPSISFLLLPFSPLCIYFLLDFSTHAPSKPLYLTLSFSYTLHLPHNSTHSLYILIPFFFFIFFLIFFLISNIQHGWHQPRRDKKRERRSGTSSFLCTLLFFFRFLCTLLFYLWNLCVPFCFSLTPWPFSSWFLLLPPFSLWRKHCIFWPVQKKYSLLQKHLFFYQFIMVWNETPSFIFKFVKTNISIISRSNMHRWLNFLVSSVKIFSFFVCF